MSEDSLRDLLHRVVPEAPAPDPARIVQRAGDTTRNRSAMLVGAAVILWTIGIGAVAVAGLFGDDRERPRPGEVATSPSEAPEPGSPPSPYDVESCPAVRPDTAKASRLVTDLDGVVAVRLCPDLNPRGEPFWSPTPEQLAELEDADALVLGLDAFATAVRRSPSALPEYCDTDQGPWISQSLLFFRADGTRMHMPAGGCELATIEGRTVHGGALGDLYLEALDRQREAADYTKPFDDKLSCISSERGGPVKPGRERLVAAVSCDLRAGAESLPEDIESTTQLSTTQLEALNQAWTHPGDPIVRGASGEHECVDRIEDPPSFIVTATDRSDVIRLIDSPCGFLVWHGSERHPGATFPTTVSKLGLE